MPSSLPGCPTFDRFRGYAGPIPAGIQCDWLGAMYRPEWLGLAPNPALDLYEPAVPSPNEREEYFEWITLLESVAAARGGFVMMELGAGYGRWGVRGALAALQLAIPRDKIEITFAEAEPHHAAWLKEAIVLNHGMAGVRTNVVEAAVAGRDGEVPFAIGHEREWYGQSITTRFRLILSQMRSKRKDFDYRPWGNKRVRIVRTKAVSLQTLLAGADIVDLIDMDIQGAEADVVESAGSVLVEHARRLFIETHNAEVERRIKKTLSASGWRNVWDFPAYHTCDTPYGPIAFEGGVQSWTNPRLVDGDALFGNVENGTADR